MIFLLFLVCVPFYLIDFLSPPSSQVFEIIEKAFINPLDLKKTNCQITANIDSFIKLLIVPEWLIVKIKHHQSYAVHLRYVAICQ